MKDMTPRFFGRQAGTRTESSRYYYVPDGQGGYYRETAVIACTISGSIGPFTMRRLVTYSAWEGDEADERWDAAGVEQAAEPR